MIRPRGPLRSIRLRIAIGAIVLAGCDSERSAEAGDAGGDGIGDAGGDGTGDDVGGDGTGDAGGDGICLRVANAMQEAPRDACLARLPLGGKTLPYYRSHALDRRHPGIENLVVIQHGNGRNAWDYYDTIAEAASARDPAHTAVVAPLFQASDAACDGAPVTPGDLCWGCSDWKEGLAAENATTSSYAALDALIAAAKQAFPELRRVTVAGYSAGGQTVQRYAAGNVEHARTPTIATRYVVGSPSSYLYFDGRRVKADAVCTSASSCALDATSFEVPAYAPGCSTTDPAVVSGSDGYDEYRYGLAKRGGYLAAISDADLRANYAKRSVVYLLSDGDASAGPQTGYDDLDRRCPAMVQAPAGSSFRLQRGLVYHRYATSLLGATHRLVICRYAGTRNRVCWRPVRPRPSCSVPEERRQQLSRSGRRSRRGATEE